MKLRVILATAVVFVGYGLVTPAYAQMGDAVAVDLVRWSIITSGFALGIAAAFGAIAMAKGLAAAAEGIARNPSAAGDIRFSLILGLVLIESLVIYVLLISLILFFVQPFSG